MTGAIKSASSASVMIAAAGPLLPPMADWSRNSTGQVATTMMTAQTKAVMNGLSIQRLAAIKTPIKSNARVVRVKSREGMEVAINALLLW